MHLPTPTSSEIEAFRALYLRRFGVLLTEEDASEAATRTLRLFCFCTYGNPEEKIRRPPVRMESKN